MVSFFPVFSYYSDLSLEEWYVHLTYAVARFEFALLTVTFFLQAASEASLDTVKCASCTKPCVPQQAALSSPVTFLVEATGICVVLGGLAYYMATAPMARDAIRSVDKLAVTPRPAAQLLSFTTACDMASFSATASTTRLVQHEKESFLTQALFFLVLYLLPPPSWISVRGIATEYLHRNREQPLPSALSDIPIFGHDARSSPDFEENFFVAPVSILCPASKQDDVERAQKAFTLTGPSTSLLDGSITSDEGPTGPVVPVLYVFLFFY